MRAIGEREGVRFPIIAFSVLFLVTLFADSISAMLSSALPMYIESVGGTAAVSGAVFSLYYMLSLVMRPVSGVLSDRLGYTRVLLLGAAACVLSALLLRAMPAAGVVFLVMALRGIGLSCVTTSSAAKLSHVLPAEWFDYGLGIFALHLSLANAVGPSVAVQCAESGGYPALFTVIVVLSLLSCAGVAYFLLRERGGAKRRGAARAQDARPAAGERGLFRILEKRALRFGVVQILSSFSLASVTVFLALLVSKRGAGNAGFFFTAAACTGALARLLTGAFNKRFTTRQILLTSASAMVLILLGLAFARGSGMLVALGLAYGLAQGTIYPTIMVRSIKSASPERKGRASATYYLCNDIGSSLGSLLWGGIVALIGYSAVYIVAAAVFIAELPLILWAFQEKKEVSQ